jgi:hypothetical protein
MISCETSAMLPGRFSRPGVASSSTSRAVHFSQPPPGPNRSSLSPQKPPLPARSDCQNGQSRLIYAWHNFPTLTTQLAVDWSAWFASQEIFLCMSYDQSQAVQAWYVCTSFPNLSSNLSSASSNSYRL